MWKAIKPVLGQILTSKKALATMAGIIAYLLAKLGVVLDPETVLVPIGLIAAYVISQGFADIGKESKKAEVQGIKELRELEDNSPGKTSA